MKPIAHAWLKGALCSLAMMIAFSLIPHLMPGQAVIDANADIISWSDPKTWQGKVVPGATDHVALKNVGYAGRQTMRFPGGTFPFVKQYMVRQISMNGQKSRDLILHLESTAKLNLSKGMDITHGEFWAHGEVHAQSLKLHPGQGKEAVASLSMANIDTISVVKGQGGRAHLVAGDEREPLTAKVIEIDKGRFFTTGDVTVNRFSQKGGVTTIKGQTDINQPSTTLDVMDMFTLRDSAVVDVGDFNTLEIHSGIDVSAGCKIKLGRMSVLIVHDCEVANALRAAGILQEHLVSWVYGAGWKYCPPPRNPKVNAFLEAASACPGTSNGSANAFVTDGIPPFLYQWSTGDTTDHIDSLSPGLYTVTITDSSGTDTTLSVQVGTLSTPSLHVVVSEAHCGSPFLASAFALPDSSYPQGWASLSTGAFSGPGFVHGLPAGTYTFTATTEEGCTATALATVTCAATLPCDSLTSSFMYSQRGDTIDFQLSAQNAASLLWDFGDGTTSIDPCPTHHYAMPGVYTVSLTTQDPYGTCTSTTQDTISTIPGPIDTAFAMVFKAGPVPSLFAVGPNPAEGLLNIQAMIGSEGPATLTLSDLQGRVVAKKEIQALPKGTWRDEWLLPSLPGGHYILQLETRAEGRRHKRVVIR